MNNITTIEHDGLTLSKTERDAAVNALEIARAYVIDCPEMAECAASELRSIATRKKQINEKLKTLISPMQEAEKRIREFFRPAITALDDARAVLEPALLTYQKEEKRKQDAIKREHEAAARRLAEEAARRAADAEKAAREAAQAGDMAAQIQAQQEAAQAAMDAEMMQHMAPVVSAAPVKQAGISTRTDWDFEITDLGLLVAAVANGQAPAALIMADEKEIRRRVKAMRSDFKAPGIRVFEKQIMSVRG